MRFAQLVKKIRGNKPPKPEASAKKKKSRREPPASDFTFKGPTKATITLVSNTRARIEGDFDFTKASMSLAYHPPGYKFSPAYRHHMWDGYVRLMTADGTFPAGLAQHVADALGNEGVEIVNPLHKPKMKVTHTNDFTLEGVTLYPWQKTAVRRALAAGRGVLKIATGGGKTEVTAGIIRGLTTSERPPKTLIIVPNRNLLTQTKKRLEQRLGHEVGTIGFGKWQEDYVTLAIPNSLKSPKFKAQRKELMAACELLIIDEAHHTASDTWNKLVSSCKAWYRFGLSGTPLDRADGSNLKLIGQTGPMLVDISSALLVSQGKLAKPTVRMVDVRHPRVPNGLDWASIYAAGIVQNEGFHDIVTREVAGEVKAGKQTLVLVTQIAHGDALSDKLTRKGIDHEWVHGKTDADDLDAVIEKFKAGELRTLIASPIFGEGTDIPSIDSLVIADGGKSAIKVVQKAGRAMRVKKAGTANTCTIVDFSHYTNEKLLRHSIRRRDTYLREEFEIVNPTVGVE